MGPRGRYAQQKGVVIKLCPPNRFLYIRNQIKRHLTNRMFRTFSVRTPPNLHIRIWMHKNYITSAPFLCMNIDKSKTQKKNI